MSAELLASRPPESESTLVLTLSNPGARNALHPDMYAAGIQALETAERDTSIRAVVLIGADDFFCAGGNLNRLLENRAKDPSVQAQSIDLLAQWILALRTSSKPVIGAVAGADRVSPEARYDGAMAPRGRQHPAGWRRAP